LASDLGVSLGAIREALSRLTAEGLVTSSTNKGFRAAPVSESELLDLTSTRIEMETACLRRSTRLGGVDWETRIVASHHRMSRIPERATDDPRRINDLWAEAHREFHAALVSACDSPWRMRLREFLYDQTERYRRLSVPALPEERDLAAEHMALMEAALARDEYLVCKLLSQHINITAGRVRALADPSSQNPGAKT
jgi:DNA-binding GntR family transcriptional regulator